MISWCFIICRVKIPGFTLSMALDKFFGKKYQFLFVILRSFLDLIWITWYERNWKLQYTRFLCNLVENYAFQFDAVLNTSMRGNLHTIMSVALGESALSCSVRPMVMTKVKEGLELDYDLLWHVPGPQHHLNPVSAGGTLLCNFMLFMVNYYEYPVSEFMY